MRVSAQPIQLGDDYRTIAPFGLGQHDGGVAIFRRKYSRRL
jgi:hypothetical protein